MPIVWDCIAAILNKNAVSANIIIVDTSIKHPISGQSNTNYYGKRLYVQMFDMVDTAFSYGRALIVC